MALPGKSSKTIKLKRDKVLNIQAFDNGSIVIRGTGPVNVRDIKAIIEQKLLEKGEKLVIVIETHPNADYGIMIDILDELRLAGAQVISLRTMRTGS